MSDVYAHLQHISFLFGINYRLIMPLLFIGYLIVVIIPN